MENKINVLGIDIDRVCKQKLHKQIEKLLIEGHHAKIFTPNPEIIIKAQKNKRIRDVLNSATLSIPDGTGIIWGAKMLGTPLPERITGIDTAEFILNLAENMGLSVFLLGGKEGVARNAKQKLEERYKKLNICGVHHGFFDVNGHENNEIIARINQSKADIIFVCMGFPRQELWITENIKKLPSVHLAIGLGGSLDVWSGNLKRAPVIFRKLSLEWLWRIILEPKRIKFLPTIPIFIFKILKQRGKTDGF